MTVALVVTLVLLAATLAGVWALWSRQVRLDTALHAVRETAAAQQTRIALLERDLADETARAGSLTEELAGLRESNRKLAEAAESTIHDLRHPLGKVIEFLDPLQRPRYAEQLDYRGKQYVRFARDAAIRLRELIDGRVS